MNYPVIRRTVSAIALVLLLVISGLSLANFFAARNYTDIAHTLSSTVKAAQGQSPDIATLQAQQEQADAQLADAQSSSWYQTPSLHAAFSQAQQVSDRLATLLRHMNDGMTYAQAMATVEGKSGTASSAQKQNSANNANSSHQSDSDAQQKEQQKQQMDQLLKNNSSDKQSSTSSDTQKPW